MGWIVFLAATTCTSACLLTTSLDGLAGSQSDAGGVDAAIDAALDVVDATLDGGREDPCAESSLIICFPFELDTAGVPPSGATATAVDLVSNDRGRTGRFSSSTKSMIRIPASTAWEVGTYTFEAWVSPRRIPAADERFGIVDSEFRAAMFFYPDGRIHCRAGTSDGTLEAISAPIQVDRFTHVACVFGTEEVSAYANGEIGERRRLAFTIGNGQPTLIGANAPSGGDHFDGLLDDVRVHGVALDAAVIQRHAR